MMTVALVWFVRKIPFTEAKSLLAAERLGQERLIGSEE
jgi:hypothetical protein